MEATEDPKKLQAAVGGLWTAYVAVLGALQLQFAQTTALAIGIAEVVKAPAIKIFGPIVAALMEPSTLKWVETIIESIITIFAVMFAWFLRRIIAAFYTGLRGGTMFAFGILNFAVDKGWLEAKYVDALDDTYVDDILGYAMAAIGFIYQLSTGFEVVPFPFSVAFWPLDFAEYFLMFDVATGGAVSGAGG